jgi:hypothetical protein
MKNKDPRINMALLSINPTSIRPAWHGCPTILGVLRGMNERIATWRPFERQNNIREITLHIAFWENSVANRISGEKKILKLEQRKTGWVKRKEKIDAIEWKNEIEILKDSHKRLIEKIENFDPKKLDKRTGPQSNRIAIEFIHGVAEHTLYHTAQIKLLRTLFQRTGNK